MAGTLRVAALPEEAVADPSYVPQVYWTMHTKSKSGSLVESYRGKNLVEQRVRVDTPIALGDRARVRLVHDVYLELRWVPCTVATLRVPQLDSDEVRRRARACGLHLVSAKQTLDTRCTHLCVAHVRPNRTQLLALVHGLPIVSTAYVEALLACPSESAWPDARLYVPPLDARLGPDAPLSLTQLAPSSRRAALFRGTTLVFVLPGRERRYVRTILTQTDLQELAEAAEGHVVVHDLCQCPLPTIHEARDMLRAAQAASDAHWAMRRDMTPVPAAFVLCGEPSAPWVPQVIAAAQQ